MTVIQVKLKVILKVKVKKIVIPTLKLTVIVLLQHSAVATALSLQLMETSSWITTSTRNTLSRDSRKPFLLHKSTGQANVPIFAVLT